MKALYELLIARSIHVSTIFQKEQLYLFLNIFSFFKQCFYLFIFGCVGSSLCMLSLVVVCKLLTAAVSPVAVHVSFSSCGAQAQLPCGMWKLPGPGIEPLFPALEGNS